MKISLLDEQCISVTIIDVFIYTVRGTLVGLELWTTPSSTPLLVLVLVHMLNYFPHQMVSPFYDDLRSVLGSGSVPLNTL